MRKWSEIRRWTRYNRIRLSNRVRWVRTGVRHKTVTIPHSLVRLINGTHVTVTHKTKLEIPFTETYYVNDFTGKTRLVRVEEPMKMMPDADNVSTGATRMNARD